MTSQKYWIDMGTKGGREAGWREVAGVMPAR